MYGPPDGKWQYWASQEDTTVNLAIPGNMKSSIGKVVDLLKGGKPLRTFNPIHKQMS